MEGILAPENLRQAWHQGKATHGAPGGEGRTSAECPALAREHWARSRQAVRDDPYQPAPARRTEIPKRQGQGTRWRGIPTGVERIIPQALAQGLGPIVDPEFSASRGGLRPGRSAPQAGKPIQSSIPTGYRIAGELDLAKCCDRVSHEALLARGARTVRDKARRRLRGKSLRAGVRVGEQLQPPATGVPPGAPVSPWWSNLL